MHLEVANKVLQSNSDFKNDGKVHRGETLHGSKFGTISQHDGVWISFLDCYICSAVYV